MAEKPKVIFIPTRYKEKIILPDYVYKQIVEKEVALASSTQFTNQLPEIKKQLEERGKIAHLNKGMQPTEGQVLGCDGCVVNASPEAEAVLYIGDGDFHPLAMIELERPVYRYNPIMKTVDVLKFDKKKYAVRKKVGFTKFLQEERIALIVSLKSGQINLRKALRFQKLYPEKKFFILLYNNVSFSDLENYPFIGLFINTACPRIYDDYDKFPKSMINLQDLRKMLLAHDMKA